jgi:hypothetical protein
VQLADPVVERLRVPDITDAQRKAQERVKQKKYMCYCYCTDTPRFNDQMPPECSYDR